MYFLQYQRRITCNIEKNVGGGGRGGRLPFPELELLRLATDPMSGTKAPRWGLGLFLRAAANGAPDPWIQLRKYIKMKEEFIVPGRS